MQLKIYVDELPIYLTNTISEELETLSSTKKVLNLSNLSEISDAFLQKTSKTHDAIVVKSDDFEALKNEFFKKYTIIEAAGGIVLNENKDVLFIFRREKWDLPKGKMEKGETPELTASREIEEETGVKNLTLHHIIGETHHTYKEKGVQILKISHWFYFTSEGKQTISPQAEEDIAEVKWVHTKDIAVPLKNTYASIKDILRTFFDEP